MGLPLDGLVFGRLVFGRLVFEQLVFQRLPIHLGLVLLSLGAAALLRGGWRLAVIRADRQQEALIRFLLPPLILTVTSAALIVMGPVGQMAGHALGRWEGWLSYGLAWGFGLAALLGLIRLAIEVVQTDRLLGETPSIDLQELLADCDCSEAQGDQLQQLPGIKYLSSASPFSALIGGWNPQLVLSQGLIDCLDRPQLIAVLLHEQAHRHYQDNRWFLGLSWLRRLTCGLPGSQLLWEELLLLRELRADRWAAQFVDPLILAEALLTIAQTPSLYPEPLTAAFSCAAPRSRLEQRLGALLEDVARPELPEAVSIAPWLWGLGALLPLLLIPFHRGFV
jgi:Zn-dependent protease with chaperone function